MFHPFDISRVRRRFRRPVSSVKCGSPDESMHLRPGHAAFYHDHQNTVILYLILSNLKLHYLISIRPVNTPLITTAWTLNGIHATLARRKTSTTCK